jgi:hypothetical protein
MAHRTRRPVWSSCRSATLLGVLSASWLLTSRMAEARPRGIDSSEWAPDGGCNDCHSGGVAPSVALQASATEVMPGQPLTLTFAVTSQNAAQAAAGFNLRSSQRGTFAVGGPGSSMTRTIANGETSWLEATHSAPKNADQMVTTFTTLWTPDPGLTGTVTFTAWGNAVNLADGRRGDRSSSATVDVTVCVPATFYRDADGDGHGNVADPRSACSAPGGYVTDKTDCDDAAAAINPAATEVCNGKDDNCDGNRDEGLGSLACGEPPCRATVPACLDGLPQVCTPVCPPPDAAPPIAPDAAPPIAPDAAPPIDPDAGLPIETDAAAPPEPDPLPPPPVDGRASGSDPINILVPGAGGISCHLGRQPEGSAVPLATAALTLLTLLSRRRRR